jgi:hypothetical protein
MKVFDSSLSNQQIPPKLISKRAEAEQWFEL